MAENSNYPIIKEIRKLSLKMDSIIEEGLGADTSGVTASASSVLAGHTFVDAQGNTIEGTIKSKGAQIYTPGASNQVINAGQYLSGNQTIKGDANLKASNIKKGASIFGVAGTVPSVTIDGVEATENLTLSKDVMLKNSPLRGTDLLVYNGMIYKYGGNGFVVYNAQGEEVNTITGPYSGDNIAFVYNGKIHIFDNDYNYWHYAYDGNTFTKMADMPTIKPGVCSLVHYGKIHFMDASEFNVTPAKHYVYNADDTFSSYGDTSFYQGISIFSYGKYMYYLPRSYDEVIYRSKDSNAINGFEVYEDRLDVSLKGGNTAVAATVEYNGKLHLFAGCNQGNHVIWDGKRTFVKAEPIPSVGLSYFHAFIYDNAIYVCGNDKNNYENVEGFILYEAYKKV